MSTKMPNRPQFVAIIFDPATQTVTRVPFGARRYAVETCFFDGSWENCWTVDDVPVTFATRAEAEAELKSYLADVADAVAAGDMCDGYDRDDFRIVEVAHD